MGSGMYAGGRIQQIEGDVGAGARVGYSQADRAYTGMFSPQETRPGGEGFEKGSVGRRSAVIWGASVVWLVLVWRAVRGF